MRIQPDPSITACDLAPLLGENVRAGASASVVTIRPVAAVAKDRTPTQAKWRIKFKDLPTLWKALSPAQKTAWAAWALIHPILNSCGDPVFHSAYNAFIEVNGVLLSFDSSFTIEDPPATFVPPEIFIDPNFSFATFCGSEEQWLLAHPELPENIGLQIWSIPHVSQSFHAFKNKGNLLFASHGQDDPLYGDPPPVGLPEGQAQFILIGLRHAWKRIFRPSRGVPSPPPLV